MNALVEKQELTRRHCEVARDALLAEQNHVGLLQKQRDELKQRLHGMRKKLLEYAEERLDTTGLQDSSVLEPEEVDP